MFSQVTIMAKIINENLQDSVCGATKPPDEIYLAGNNLFFPSMYVPSKYKYIWDPNPG